MSAHRPQAVIFDLDGTLIDSLAQTFAAMREAVTPFLERPPTDQEIYARFGPADHWIVGEMVPPERREAAVRRLMEAYERGLAATPVFPGVRAMLEALAARGLKLGLCTGRGRPSTDLLIDRLGLAPFFAASVTGEEVPRAKPAPDGIRATAAKLGVAPEATVYVGDSIKDVEAGLAAGAWTIAALWGGIEGEPPGFQRAHARARRPSEVVESVAALLVGSPGGL